MAIIIAILCLFTFTGTILLTIPQSQDTVKRRELLELRLKKEKLNIEKQEEAIKQAKLKTQKLEKQLEKPSQRVDNIDIDFGSKCDSSDAQALIDRIKKEVYNG